LLNVFPFLFLSFGLQQPKFCSHFLIQPFGRILPRFAVLLYLYSIDLFKQWADMPVYTAINYDFNSVAHLAN